MKLIWERGGIVIVSFDTIGLVRLNSLAVVGVGYGADNWVVTCRRVYF